MAGLARKLAPAAALGGLALVIVGVADPALAGHTDATATGATARSTVARSGSQSQSGASQSHSGTSAQSGASGAGATCDTGTAVTGPSVMTRWGPVQVAATIANGQLCEVHAIAWPSGDGRSIAINDYAIPVLDASASQLGTQFDAVSGATYTSDGYRESLQQLLDSL